MPGKFARLYQLETKLNFSSRGKSTDQDTASTITSKTSPQKSTRTRPTPMKSPRRPHQGTRKLRCNRCTRSKHGCDGARPVCGNCSKSKDKGESVCRYPDVPTSHRDLLEMETELAQQKPQDSEAVEGDDNHKVDDQGGLPVEKVKPRALTISQALQIEPTTQDPFEEGIDYDSDLLPWKDQEYQEPERTYNDGFSQLMNLENSLRQSNDNLWRDENDTFLGFENNNFLRYDNSSFLGHSNDNLPSHDSSSFMGRVNRNLNDEQLFHATTQAFNQHIAHGDRAQDEINRMRQPWRYLEPKWAEYQAILPDGFGSFNPSLPHGVCTNHGFDIATRRRLGLPPYRRPHLDPAWENQHRRRWVSSLHP